VFILGLRLAALGDEKSSINPSFEQLVLLPVYTGGTEPRPLVGEKKRDSVMDRSADSNRSPHKN
jgi:hypothetical protein